MCCVWACVALRGQLWAGICLLPGTGLLYLLSQLIGPSSAFLRMPLKGLLEAPLPFLDIRSAPTSKELFSASFPLKLQAQVAAGVWHGWKGSWAVGEPQCALTMPEGPGFWGTSQTKQNLGEWWELRVSL